MKRRGENTTLFDLTLHVGPLIQKHHTKQSQKKKSRLFIITEIKFTKNV